MENFNINTFLNIHATSPSEAAREKVIKPPSDIFCSELPDLFQIDLNPEMITNTINDITKITNVFLSTKYPSKELKKEDIGNYFSPPKGGAALLLQAASADRIFTRLTRLNMPNDKAEKVARFAAQFLSTPGVIGQQGAYLRKEESELPFTVQVGYGQMFLLLKSKIPDTIKNAGSFKLFRSVVDVNTGERFAQCIVNVDDAVRKSLKRVPDEPEKTTQFDSYCAKLITELKAQEEYSDIPIINYAIYTAKDTRAKFLPQNYVQYEGDRMISIIVPFAEGTGLQLKSLVKSPDELKQQFVELGHNLLKLHENGKAHSDIKPANILIFRNGNQLVPRFGDFGYIIDLTQKIRRGGTPLYTHPAHKIKPGSVTLEHLDLWAFAVTLLEILHPNAAHNIIVGKKLETDQDKITLINNLITEIKTQTEHKEFYPLILGLMLGSTEDKSGINQEGIEEIKTIKAFLRKLQYPAPTKKRNEVETQETDATSSKKQRKD